MTGVWIGWLDCYGFARFLMGTWWVLFLFILLYVLSYSSLSLSLSLSLSSVLSFPLSFFSFSFFLLFLLSQFYSLITTAHLWCGSHSISISACGVWGGGGKDRGSSLQEEIHTHIHLD